MIKTALAITVLSLTVTACSTTRHCERALPYQAAEMATIVTSVDGISPPSSPSALRCATGSTRPRPVPQSDSRLMTSCDRLSQTGRPPSATGYCL